MDTREYLAERIRVVIPESNKIYNHGALLLAMTTGWEDMLDDILGMSWDTLLKYCIRNKQSTHKASVKLTFASDLIGKRICKMIGAEEDIKATLALGDLLLETFLQDDLIDIEREHAGHKAPYMVRIIGEYDGVKPTLIGTSFEPLGSITGLFSPLTGEPFIKGWTDSKKFKQYLDCTFVKSLEKLRNEAWRLNEKVYATALANPPEHILRLCNKDGVIFEIDVRKAVGRLPKRLQHMDGTKFLGLQDARLQRLASKYFEYNQIMRKAAIVREHGGPFYQEVSCDYRGRTYYAESFLEFQGNDLARSLFEFDARKPITARGYRWLCIQAATSFNQSYTTKQLRKLAWTTTDYVSHLRDEGLDSIEVGKMSLEDRYQWTQQNLNRFGNLVLEAEAEKPYAFLAAMTEIVNFLNDPTYETGIPISSDGSNNGWQHLAAMSKDKQAGALVSLTPSKLQKDFYVAVAKDLIRLLPEWFEVRAIPMKHIRKGIAKRGSMTRAYSAGKLRIAKNMYDDCHVEGFTLKYNISEGDSLVLADNLIKAINQVCAGPLRTTKYLQKIAAWVLDGKENHMEWHTPSGFPVIYKAFLQHERKQRGTIRGILGNKDGRVMHVVRVDAVSKDNGVKLACRRSFASGISPNFVHSIDAAHMANTIVSFSGSFAAVHDSFSTHPSDVDALQEVTKSTFIGIYDTPNFFDTMDEMLGVHRRGPGCFTVAQPPLGTLNVREVRDSEYFFS
jgi:DNA-directed RNA polymerase